MPDSMLSNVGTCIALGVIRIVSAAYDIITIPVFTLLQSPWKTELAKSNVYAAPLDPDEPSSPWVLTDEQQIDIDALAGATTIDQLLRKSVRLHKSKKSLGYRPIIAEENELQPDGRQFRKLDLGDYKWMTYKELDETVDLIGKGFLASGVRPRQNVVIYADTRIEWMLAAQALLRLNVTVATLYATLGEDGIVHGINEAESTHIVTSQDLLPKIAKSLSRLTSLTHIIYMENLYTGVKPQPVTGINMISWSDLKLMGATCDPELRGETPTGDDVAILMYTSGSTGIPKGVMITHQNIVSTARGFSPPLLKNDSTPGDDTFIAYLPLAHVLELAAESLALAFGCRVGYSTSLTLTDRSTAIKKGQKGDATLLQPTVIAAVPLVLDRIRKAMTEAASARGKFAGAFFDWAVKYKISWQKYGYDTPLLNRLVFAKIKQAVGGRVRIIASGSAPLSVDTHLFMKAALGCELVQGYGLTETAAGATIMNRRDVSKGRVGSPLLGAYIKLVDWTEAGYLVTDEPRPRGEILVGGNTVAKGYYKNEELTKESFKTEGGIRWFYTGDIGEFFPDGTLKIIDRKKDLVKLQFGEYVSLGKIETVLKTLPFVDNVCVIGSSLHTYLVALISPNEKALCALADQLGKQGMSTKELCNDRDMVNSITKTIIDLGKKEGLNKMEIPNKIKLCAEDWLPDSGLVTAAMKIRRKQIEQFYQRDIDRFYADGDAKSA